MSPHTPSPSNEPDRDLVVALSQSSALPPEQIVDLLRQQPTQPVPDGAEVLLRMQHVPRPLSEVFPFFAQAENLQCLTPPFLDFRILTPLPIAMQQGARIDYRIRLRGLPMRWRTRISAWQPPHRFADEQISGPYRVWWHEHLFAEHEGGTLITDRVVYKAPLALIAHPLMVRRELARIFDYRRHAIGERFGERAKPDPR
jgi:hypothetical protein